MHGDRRTHVLTAVRSHHHGMREQLAMADGGTTRAMPGWGPMLSTNGQKGRRQARLSRCPYFETPLAPPRFTSRCRVTRTPRKCGAVRCGVVFNVVWWVGWRAGPPASTGQQGRRGVEPRGSISVQGVYFKYLLFGAACASGREAPPGNLRCTLGRMVPFRQGDAWSLGVLDTEPKSPRLRGQ